MPGHSVPAALRSSESRNPRKKREPHEKQEPYKNLNPTKKTGLQGNEPTMRIEENAGKLPDIKKAADRASSVCRKQECYLKWELLLTKKLWDVLFLL